MSAKEQVEPNRNPKRNRWKIAFFVALIAFEFAREFAVLAADQKAEPNATKFIFSAGSLVTATGSWKRSDGGSPIVPGTVTIECWRDKGQCVEASVMGNEQWFFAPQLDWFEAKFTDEGVTYVNDNPDCARYAVRIDTVTKRAFATRDRKENPVNENCQNLEKRIAMELADSFTPNTDPTKGHFVPLIEIFFAVARPILG